MKKIVTILLTLVIIQANGQDLFLSDSRQYGKPLEALGSDEIKGSPYLMADWSVGLALAAQGKAQVKLPKMRYNVLKEQIEFESDNRVLYLDKNLFTKFMIITKGDTMTFKNGIKGVKKINENAYAQVIWEGKNLWIKKTSKSLINDPEAPYGSTKMKLIQNEENYFLVKPSGESVLIKLTKRAFIKTFESQVPDIAKFLESNSIMFDNDRDLKKMFMWLDQQL